MHYTIPNRKNIRLHPFAYENTGLYFITLCTQNRKCLFGSIGDDKLIPSSIGTTVISIIDEYRHHYPGIEIQQYVVMPNHIHFLIFRNPGNESHAISLSRFISHMKSFITLQCGKSFWQRGFYDHVVRTEQDKLEIMEYIQNNPRKWAMDKEFIEE